MSEEIKAAEETVESKVQSEEKTAESKPKKEKGFSEGVLEVLTAVFLGITALLTAWASWIGSLHGGNQATNYTRSNNLSAMGNSMYNEAAQNYMQDMLTWNSINSYLFDEEIARQNGNIEEADLIDEKIDLLIADSCTEDFQEAIEWAFNQDAYVTPFDMEGYFDSYFAEANDVLDEADELLEEGRQDNANGDAYGLVTVIYSLVLFLLGIIGIFKRIPNRTALMIVSWVFLVIATVYMLTIPLPTGFNLLSFFIH